MFCELPLLASTLVDHRLPAEIAAISRSRAGFEQRFFRFQKNKKGDEGLWENMHSDAKEALFPVGVGTRRYLLINALTPNCPYASILFQSIQGGKSRTTWRLILVPKKQSKRPSNGTLAKLLWDRGYVLDKATPASSLPAFSASKSFAAYRCEALGDCVQAWVVSPAGKEGKHEIYSLGETKFPRVRHALPEFMPVTVSEQDMIVKVLRDGKTQVRSANP